MAKQEINIGVEGNDGTGDSIRESFKKTNENFTELYAVFGVGGQITFTTLSDTPDNLTPSTVPLVNTAGTQILLAELGSNSDLPVSDSLYSATDTVTFRYNVAGKLDLVTKKEFEILKKLIEKQQKEINKLKKNRSKKARKS